MTEDPGERFSYDDGDATFESHLVRPHPGATACATVVLGHDWSGINGGMRAVAQRIASMGYACVVLDVYGAGVRGDERGDNHHLMDPLLADRGRLRRRLLAGFAATLALPAVDRDRVAALGFCFGGLCVLDLARAAPPELRAVITVHALLTPTGLAPTPITASVLVLHGWEDPFAPPSAVLALADELTHAGADWQLHAYGHAMHAFTFEGMRAPERGLAHHPIATRRAWATIAAGLAEHLGPGS